MELEEGSRPPSLTLGGYSRKAGQLENFLVKRKDCDVPQALWTPSNLMSQRAQVQSGWSADLFQILLLFWPTQNWPPLGSFRKWVQAADTHMGPWRSIRLGALFSVAGGNRCNSLECNSIGNHMSTCLGHWTPRNVLEVADL